MPELEDVTQQGRLRDHDTFASLLPNATCKCHPVRPLTIAPTTPSQHLLPLPKQLLLPGRPFLGTNDRVGACLASNTSESRDVNQRAMFELTVAFS